MKHIRNLTLATTLALCTITCHSLAADTVSALYQFGVNTTTTYASTDADENSLASNLLIGSGLTNQGISISTGDPIPAFFSRGLNNSTEALAFSQGKYISFTITPTDEPLSITSLSFDFYREATAARNYALYFSTTGSFTSGAHIDANVTPFSSVTTWTNYSVDLSDIPSLQSISSTATFRLYFWGADTGASEAILRLDNVTLTTAAIPEPSTYALFASGGLFLLAMSRRRAMQRRQS